MIGEDFVCLFVSKSIKCNSSGFREKKPVDIVFFFGDSSHKLNLRTQIPEEMTKTIIFKSHIA